MKIIDGLKLEGDQDGKVEIPDCKRNDLPEFFKQMGFKVGAEIGVDYGRFSVIFLKAGLKLYAIDPWLNYSEYSWLQIDQAQLDRHFKITKKRLAPYDCTIIRKTSMEAVKDFKDDSLDFVYIDGNHGFKYVTEDIYEWSKKVKRGGIIAGHDYLNGELLFHKDVKWVVDNYTKAAHIDKWYILGKETDKERDRDRSWFWINI